MTVRNTGFSERAEERGNGYVALLRIPLAQLMRLQGIGKQGSIRPDLIAVRIISVVQGNAWATLLLFLAFLLDALLAFCA